MAPIADLPVFLARWDMGTMATPEWPLSPVTLEIGARPGKAWSGIERKPHLTRDSVDERSSAQPPRVKPVVATSLPFRVATRVYSPAGRLPALKVE